MKNFHKALLAVFFLPLMAFGQSNYKPGYVVTLKGDTLHGFIDYREWNSTPTSINFKTAVADAKAREFTPKEISFFNINGLEAYQKYSGPISMDPTEIDHIGSSRDTSTRIAVVFFKILQKGNNLVLYSYTDNLKARFYAGEAPGYRPTELSYRLYYDSGPSVSENTYMKQLFALATKYQVQDSDLQWSIEHAGYNSDDMLKIVSKINHISKTEYEKTHTAGWAKFNLFLGVAANINNISTPTSSPYYTTGGRSVTSTLPAVSFGINLFANPSTRQLQFRLELGAAQSQFKSLYNSKVYPYIPMKASFDELAFSVAPQIIYNFYNAENFKVYGGAGLSFTIFNFSNPYLGSQSQPNSATDIQANNPYFFNTADDGFLLKAGVQFGRHWGIFAQYVSNIAITKGGYFQLSSSDEQIGVNYFFK